MRTRCRRWQAGASCCFGWTPEDLLCDGRQATNRSNTQSVTEPRAGNPASVPTCDRWPSPLPLSPSLHFKSRDFKTGGIRNARCHNEVLDSSVDTYERNYTQNWSTSNEYVQAMFGIDRDAQMFEISQHGARRHWRGSHPRSR